MSLTKYLSGSIQELWTLSYPLMLTTLAVLTMLFVDRVFLTFYSQEAFNASINASSTSWSLLVFLMTLGGISSVFVSQYNGRGLKEKFGEPVWQMIWMGVFSFAIFFPISIYLPDLYWGPQRPLEKQYFQWVIFFGPFYAFYGAFMGFFLGQGKTKMICYLALATNVVNIIFDWLLIFGLEGVFSGFGIAGAAIATSLSLVFQVIFLASVFFKKKYRTCGTADWKLKGAPFLECLKIGFPGAIAQTLEVFGWSLVYEFMTRRGSDYITAIGIFQSILLILIPFQDGLSKGISIIVGNLIGGKQDDLIPKVLKSGVKLIALYSVAQIIAFILIGKPTVGLFLTKYTGDLNLMTETVYHSLIFLMIYFLFDGIRYVLSGALAAGDTFFLLIAGILSIWVFFVLPVYIALFNFNATILESIFVTNVYSVFALAILVWRYKSGHWKQLDLSKD